MFRMILVLLSAMCCCHPASAQSEIPGHYQARYLLTGYDIEIRDDGTFSYQVHSDVYDRETSGTWELIAPGLIHVTTAGDPPLESTISPEIRAQDDITVEVVDEKGEPCPEASVSVSCTDGRRRGAISRADGSASFEGCPVSGISVFLQSHVLAKLETDQPNVNHFTVKLAYDETGYIDALWYIHEGSLYLLRQGIPRKQATHEDP